MGRKKTRALNSLSLDVYKGEVSVIAVCTAQGDIGWVPSDDLRILEIDGKQPSALVR